MPDFLFEIVSEEIPPFFQKKACAQLQSLTEKLWIPPLFAREIVTFVSPRRLAVLVKEVTYQPLLEEEKKGPLVQAGSQALEGFCRSLSIRPEQCHRKSTPQGMAWFARITRPQLDLEAQLISFCHSLLHNFFWPKRMRWRSLQTWVRPIRRLVTLYGNQPLQWSWEGLTAERETEGHRLWRNLETSRNTFVLTEPSHYETDMAQALVMVDSEKRQDQIRKEVHRLANLFHCVPWAANFEALVEENAALTQWPSALLAAFDPLFLQLPDPVIVTALQVHQRCFALTAQGKLAPHFVVILDGPLPEFPVKQGYERVVKARLSDALFFWQTDRQRPLETHALLLKERIFFQDLGSMAHKVERLMAGIALLLDQTGHSFLKSKAIQAASLCKADLATAMVREFSDLQGTMGTIYAHHEGIDPEVCQAISDHYAFQKGEKGSLLGALLAIVDGMDTLVGFFALNKKPSSSKDPMALRRVGNGVVRAILAHGLSFLPLSQAFLTLYHAQGWLEGKTCDGLESFLCERLAYLLVEEEGIPEIYIKSMPVLHPEKISLWTYAEKIRAQACIFQKPEGHAFLTAYRRLHALIHRLDSMGGGELDREALTTPQEKRLLALLEEGPLVHLNPWTDALNDFFDHVRVIDSPHALARMRLLGAIKQFFSSLGNLSVLWGDEARALPKN